MTEYETTPRPITAMQWDGTNLTDLLVFLRNDIKIPATCLNYADYAERVKERSGTVAVQADRNGRTALYQGEYIIRNGDGSFLIQTPAQFNSFYRKVATST